MKDYKVSFFKIEKEVDKSGNETGRKESYLGCVTVSDMGTSDDFTLQAKAYRICSSLCQTGDKVLVERIK